MAEILVRLDGETEPRPLTDLAWECIAPCGCTSGCMVAETPDRDAAYREFLPNAEARKRDEALGFVFRLGEHRAVVDRIQVRCPHQPAWGVDRPPIPPGHRWAHATGARRKHLVAVPESEDKHRFLLHAAPLCGGKRDLFGYTWGDQPECATCEKRARALGAEVTS